MLTVVLGRSLEVERGPDWLLVRLHGLDWLEAEDPALADQVWSLLEQHLTHRLVLELDEVEVLNSHLIGQLADLYRRIEEHEGVMRICGLSPRNRQALHACRLDDRLLPYRSRKDAVMGGPQLVKAR
jgi:anti-anti-sigma factor